MLSCVDNVIKWLKEQKHFNVEQITTLQMRTPRAGDPWQSNVGIYVRPHNLHIGIFTRKYYSIDSVLLLKETISACYPKPINRHSATG